MTSGCICGRVLCCSVSTVEPVRGWVPCWASFAKLILPLLPSRFELEGAGARVWTVSVVPLVVSSISHGGGPRVGYLEGSGYRILGSLQLVVLHTRGARAEVVSSHSCRESVRVSWSEEEVVIPT
ncbi:hypothetical protein Taro_002753 [Colocasia esculenta]|uniref:Uncharacterized protein n=1 Tax=Colocasia esculenta TaxID=4460 RepID=A0A843TMC9_COLES|nr:hypothetical protein [Colocasia esculenta]